MKQYNRDNTTYAIFYAYLSNNEFSWWIKTRNKVGIYVIRPFFVIGRLEFDSWMVVRQNIRETIFGTINWHVGSSAKKKKTSINMILK